MKKKEEYLIGVKSDSIDTKTLIAEGATCILTSAGKLMLDGNEIAEMGDAEVTKWVTTNNSKTFNLNPPKEDIKVQISIQGTHGPHNLIILSCIRIVEKTDGIPKAKKSFIKKIIKLEFRGSVAICPGKQALMNEIRNDKKPSVTFKKKPATNEVDMYFEKQLAGTANLNEETRNLDWDNIKNDSVKQIELVEAKIEVEIEITEEEKVDYSSILAIAESIGMPKEQAQKRIDIMANRYFMSKEEIEFIAKSWKQVKPSGLDFIPDIDGIHYVDGPDRSLYFLLGYYAEAPEKNLRLVGIQSTGKNTLVEQLASLLWKPLLQLSCSRETSREDFEGAVTLGHKVYKHDREELERDLLKEGFTPFQEATMRAKIKELSTENVVQTLEFLKEPLVIGAIEGWWVLLDEINLATSSVTSRFHSLLDYRREITVPKLGTIKAADGFSVVATMNPNSFAGASNMNQAFETRFRTITLTARESIADILMNQCPKANKEEVKLLDELYKSIYDNVQSEKIPDSFLSVRNFIDALSIKGFAPLKERVKHNIVYISVNEPEANVILGDLVDTLF